MFAFMIDWGDDQIFITNYQKLGSAQKMAELYHVNKTSVLNHAKKLGYINHYRRELSGEENRYILENYYQKTAQELAHELKCSKSLITKVWTVNGFAGKTRRVYRLGKEDYFENIDSSNKAYFLGLLASDGCVYSKKEKHSNSSYLIKLSLSAKDQEILEIFKSELQTDKPLAYRKGIDSNHSDIVTLEIVSDKIANDLLKFNITPNKTPNIFNLDLVPKEYIHDYFRGYLDGDGSISKSNSSSGKRAQYCGFKDNLLMMQAVACQFNIELSYRKDNRNYTYGEFGYLGTKNKEELIKFYDGANTYFSRKKDRADAILKLFGSTDQKG